MGITGTSLAVLSRRDVVLGTELQDYMRFTTSVSQRANHTRSHMLKLLTLFFFLITSESGPLLEAFPSQRWAKTLSALDTDTPRCVSTSTNLTTRSSRIIA